MTELPFTEKFAASWQEWLDYRREKHWSPYKPIGLKWTIKDLLLISNNDEATAIAILEQSMCKGWRGLFKLKNYYNGNQSAANKRQQATSDFLREAEQIALAFGAKDNRTN